MIKILKYLIEAIFIYLFFIIIKLIGLKVSRFVFSNLFQKLGPKIKSEKIVDNNLKIFSNKISEDKKNDIKKNMWKNYAMTFVEYMFLNKFRKEDKHINIEGKEILNKIASNNEPVVFVSGHFANFELMSMEITKSRVKLATIYRPLNNIFLNPYMEFLRKKYICKNQIKKGRLGVKQSVQYLKDGVSIALMIDQRVGENERVSFFNKEAHTTSLPAQLAFKYNLNIVPIFLMRVKNENFLMKIYEPIDTKKFKKKIELTKELNGVLEKMIIKNPNDWIWTHNRWK